MLDHVTDFTIPLNTGKPLRYVLFETQAENTTGKTTAMGSITEECQIKFHSLLGELVSKLPTLQANM
jgi:hypothetical protein